MIKLIQLQNYLSIFIYVLFQNLFKMSSFWEFFGSYRAFKIVCLDIFRFAFEEESESEVTIRVLYSNSKELYQEVLRK